MGAANQKTGHQHGCSLHVPIPVRSHNLRTSVAKVRESHLSPPRQRARTMIVESKKLPEHQRDTAVAAFDSCRIRLPEKLAPSTAIENIHRLPTRHYTCGLSTLARSDPQRSSYHQLGTDDTTNSLTLSLAGPDILENSYHRLHIHNIHRAPTRYPKDSSMPTHRISTSTELIPFIAN